MRAKTTGGQRDTRLGPLDALRLFAAMAVVGFHFTAAGSPGWNGPVPASFEPVGSWAVYGRLGVPLFFVISGFVLLMSSWGRTVPGFVASRVGRLFPAYWVAVAFSLVLVLYVWPENLDFFGKEVTTAGGLLNFTMVQAAFGVPDIDGPYWTLWYEARFYALIALLMLVGMTRQRILAFCALWPIVGAMAAHAGNGLLTAILMPDYAPFFAGGMLLYLVYRDGHDLGTWLLIGMQTAFGLNFALGFYPVALANETPWPPSKAVIALVTVACFGLVALVTLTPIAHRNARWMTLAGALTYPVYLIHQNLGLYVIHRTRESLGPWTAVALAVLASLVAGYLLYRLVEQPFSGRLRKATLAMLQSTLRAPEATVAPAAPAAPVAAPPAAPVAAPAVPVAAVAPEWVSRPRQVPLPVVPGPRHAHSAAHDRLQPVREPQTAAMSAQLFGQSTLDVPEPATAARD